MKNASKISTELVATKKVSKIQITKEMLEKIESIEYCEIVEKEKRLKPKENSYALLMYNIFKKANDKCSNGYVIRQMQELFNIKVYHSQVLLVRRSYIEIAE